jgi:uncharacterized protein YecT (DUF1311 family)
MRNRSTIVFALLAVPLLLALTPSRAHAQCDNPKTSAQRAQCVGEELRGADRTINRVYGDLMKSLSPGDRVTLRNDQRAWIKMRDENCGLTWSKGDREAWLGDLLKDYQKTVCVVRFTNDRVQALYGYQKSNSVAPAAPAAAAGSDTAPVYDLFTREHKTKGKWYFEVTVDEPGIQRLADATFSVGVLQLVVENGVVNKQGTMNGSLITIRRTDSVSRYALGYAIDLDNAKLYARKNGEWEGGVPGSSGGLNLTLGRESIGILSSSVPLDTFLKSHLLDVNFGERGFAYNLPDGYSPLKPN